LGKLKSGEDVTLANGNLVKASDVCDPDDPGPVFIGTNEGI
jgi:ribonuclease Z